MNNKFVYPFNQYFKHHGSTMIESWTVYNNDLIKLKSFQNIKNKLG